MNTITIELCAEDRARLDKILEALSSRRDCEACTDSIVHYVADTVASQTPAQPSQDAQEEAKKQNSIKTPSNEETPKKEQQAPIVTTSDLQKKVVDLCAKGKKAQVREIVNAYASKVSDVPEDKRAEVMDKLNALEG